MATMDSSGNTSRWLVCTSTAAGTVAAGVGHLGIDAAHVCSVGGGGL